jgi:hypothetical protein
MSGQTIIIHTGGRAVASRHALSAGGATEPLLSIGDGVAGGSREWSTESAYATDSRFPNTERFLGLLLFKDAHLILKHFALQMVLPFVLDAFKLNVVV